MAFGNGGLRGTDLRRARRLADLSQRDIAEALGVTRQRISNVEGMAAAPARFAARFLAALDSLTRTAE